MTDVLNSHNGITVYTFNTVSTKHTREHHAFQKTKSELAVFTSDYIFISQQELEQQKLILIINIQ